MHFILKIIRGDLHAREDSEHEQALIRLIILSCIILYLMFSMTGEMKSLVYTIMFISIFFAISLLLLIIIFPQKSVSRRIAGMLLDITATSCFMSILGEAASPIFGVYLWVTLGNGFRYGATYLYISMVLSLVGFSIVMLASPYWIEQRILATGLIASMLVIPLYVSTLLKRLNEAIEHAEVTRRCSRADSTTHGSGSTAI